MNQKDQLEKHIAALLDQIPQYEALIDQRSTKFWLKEKSVKLFGVFGVVLLGATFFSLNVFLPTMLALSFTTLAFPAILAVTLYGAFKSEEVIRDHSAEAKSEELKDAIELLRSITLSPQQGRKVLLAMENEKLPAVFWEHFNDLAREIKKTEKKDAATQKIQDDLEAMRQELFSDPTPTPLSAYDLSAPSSLVPQTIIIDEDGDDLVKMGDPAPSSDMAQKPKVRSV